MIAAFKVFDREGKEWIHRDELVRLLTSKGEDILSPPEVTALLETFPHPRIDFREFAQKMQGTWVEPRLEEHEVSSLTSSKRTERTERTERTYAGSTARAREARDDTVSIAGSVSSFAPSMAPSMAPSAVPSVAPSMAPSAVPSMAPSSASKMAAEAKS
eukprot:NODE_892_length_1390_cov_95.047726_g744_i0.p1 GENE.NODE_892_length_1390_cov_95.047726_g744_i0~~NODE_892_length_1390_cov_95.047726_g744_i0.p1  ORF type:complete len:159 (+),score=36.49 NODE_892_length_1390_cov_95.047726_g744_i0:853-1329(+)